MTNEELKEALMNRRPIIACIPLLGKIEYAYVSAITYKRNEQGGVNITAQLMDKCLHSVLEIDPKHIAYKDRVALNE